MRKLRLRAVKRLVGCFSVSKQRSQESRPLNSKVQAMLCIHSFIPQRVNAWPFSARSAPALLPTFLICCKNCQDNPFYQFPPLSFTFISLGCLHGTQTGSYTLSFFLKGLNFLSYLCFPHLSYWARGVWGLLEPHMFPIPQNFCWG